MLRFLAITALTLIGNVLGLLVASWLLDGFSITLSGFVWSVIVFTIAEIILAPFVLSMAVRYVPALRGGIAIVTTFIVLVVTTVFTDGVSIAGVKEWVLAPLIIWLVTVLSGVLLPLFMFKKALGNIKEHREEEKAGEKAEKKTETVKETIEEKEETNA